MRLRYRSTRTGEWIEGVGSAFNIHALSEVIMYFDGEDGGCDTMPTSELEVFVQELGTWRPFHDAAEARDIITDNLNTRFFEPVSPADRERGFTL